MADTITPEVQAQLETLALNNPHQLFVVDRALKIDIGGFISHVTLGNTTPNGQIIAVASLTLSTDILHSLATTILEAIVNEAPQIKAEHAVLQRKLSKAT